MFEVQDDSSIMEATDQLLQVVSGPLTGLVGKIVGARGVRVIFETRAVNEGVWFEIDRSALRDLAE